ncbi:zinc-binding alcohol dehydrogenase family protein [Fructobacillus sp. M1-13]|uniref:Zinc-binding alcohol dehydrogenase family protein n=1 Tax=Fructobacillus papyriferae TaxID=2713171 RepID=A0ABS5QPD7_9LACO|nr:zinc-binding alcohol dehydrogenase family protein [Fructobacillus papyriferae]MBS9334747.1 zinc-binding alcohol dehydrogenase family protein [Fructobacillus papyriferae]MCD2158737.1 zinc-binding alcohol dehydrogenase family protein [Fructobacillus papyriferae]
MAFKSVIESISDHFRPKMDAVGVTHNGLLQADDAFIERSVNQPQPKEDELLVQVLASSVNPVDVKMRAGYQDKGVFRIFGLDVVGRVAAVGSAVSGFEVGERVFYVGKQHHAGADAAYQVINAKMVAKAPEKLDDVSAAAMPLTSVTAYDILEHGFHLSVKQDAAKGKTLFIINGAGGVGSVLIQLAKYMGMTVLATAGNHDSKAWVKRQGADHVLDYHKSLVAEARDAGYTEVDYIADLQDTTAYWDLMVQLIRPYGEIASIVDTTLPVDLGELKAKSAGFSWIFMLARGNNNIYLEKQGEILQAIAKLLDDGSIRSTVTKVYHGLSAYSIRSAFQDVAGHHAIGKVVVDFAPNIKAAHENLGPGADQESKLGDGPDDVQEHNGQAKKTGKSPLNDENDTTRY